VVGANKGVHERLEVDLEKFVTHAAILARELSTLP
jgi:hypothetical protein